MSESINAEFEAYVKAELGDIAVVSEGRFISPKIQNYYKIWNNQQTKITELESQVEALRKDAEWQPIETAPKDGTRLLLIIDHGEHGDKIWTGLWADGWAVSYGKPENAPTHWKPLPQPPAIKGGQA
jgi:hypothetical protein